jgi:hypothetical protein
MGPKLRADDFPNMPASPFGDQYVSRPTKPLAEWLSHTYSNRNESVLIGACQVAMADIDNNAEFADSKTL